MNAFSKLVQDNLDQALQSMRGRATDERVTKAAKPLAPQIDQPAGLGNTPPAQQAHDMYEGIDLTQPQMLNDMYQRYGPAFMHAAVKKHSSKKLSQAASHPDLHPRVKVLLHAAAAVRKAYQGGKPSLGGPPQYPDSTPSISIPGRPSHGSPGDPVTTYPATVGNTSRSAATAAPNPNAINQEPQTAGQASRSAGDARNQPVKNQWVYTPSKGNPVNGPKDKRPIGVGDNDDPGYTNHVGQVQVGDLVHFNGPGGSKFQAKVTQLTTGAVIGEFAGQSVQFPTDSIFPHNVGGADHAPTGPAAPTGGTPPMPAKGGKVSKEQRDAIYTGGQNTVPGATGAGVNLKSPDDGAPLTPYNSGRPYDAEAGAENGAAPGNNVNGYLTPRERQLIQRVMNPKSPGVTEAATLKALKKGEDLTPHVPVIKAALQRHALAVPANRGVVASIIKKL